MFVLLPAHVQAPPVHSDSLSSLRAPGHWSVWGHSLKVVPGGPTRPVGRILRVGGSAVRDAGRWQGLAQGERAPASPSAESLVANTTSPEATVAVASRENQSQARAAKSRAAQNCL